jgi:hypothetical protein
MMSGAAGDRRGRGAAIVPLLSMSKGFFPKETGPPVAAEGRFWQGDAYWNFWTMDGPRK